MSECMKAQTIQTPAANSYCASSKETVPETTALAARARKATRGLSDENFFGKSHVRMHEDTDHEGKTELYGLLLYCIVTVQGLHYFKISIIPHLQ